MYEITYYRDGQPLAECPDNRINAVEDYQEAIGFAKGYIESKASGPDAGAIIRKVVYALYRPHAQSKYKIVRVEYSTECAAADAIAVTPREYNATREFIRREVLKEWHIGGTETVK